MAVTIQDLFSAATVHYTPKSRRSSRHADDRRKLKAFLHGLSGVVNGKVGVSTGWFEGEQSYENGNSVAGVARQQEFGSSNTYQYDFPRGWKGLWFGNMPRPFMRPAFDGNSQKWIEFIGNSIKKELAKGKKGNLETPFEKLGLMVQSDIQEAIHNVTSPGLRLAVIYARAVRKGVLPDHFPSTPGDFLTKLTAGEKEILFNLAADQNFSKPLEDTGVMISTVAYKVKGGVKAK